MEEIILTGKEGYVIMRATGENGVVSVTARDSKNYGLIRVLTKQLAKVLSTML